MEYISNNIMKIENIFHISKDKCEKKIEKVTFVLKNVRLCYFFIPFCPVSKRFSCINKILCVCIFITIDSF